MRRLAIINNLPGSLGDYCFEGIAKHFRSDFDIMRIDTLEERLPQEADAWIKEERLDAVIIDGSLCSPLDSEKWIRDEERFIREIVPAGLPVLGICFGHEIIASTFNGSLEKKGPSLTVEEWDVEIREHDDLFAGFGDTTRQVVAHSVQVARAPEHFLVTALTPDCPVQAMRHEQLPVYSVQFHPEVDREIKIHDPDWNPLTDKQLDSHDGPALLKNFLGIVNRYLQHTAD